jgi:D-aspartate ligase
VVLGTYVTGLAEARALARHGIPVIGVDERMQRYTSYSSAWTTVVTTPHFESATLIDVLADLAAQLPQRPTLFISTDEQVKLMSMHGVARLRELYSFDFPARETVDVLMSKEAFASLARTRGWPIPATIAAESREQLLAAVASMRYPMILKPRLKNLASRENTSQKAYRCTDRAALERAYADVSPWEREVIVQEFIPGTDADVHYSFHYFASDMREICAFEGHKIRQWIPEVGSTASSEPVHPPVIIERSREILTSVACCGFCSVEYKHDPRSGEYYITEPTVGRVNLQLGTALANGADLVSRAYFHLNGLAYPGREVRTYDRKWVYLRADLKSARFYVKRGDLTWRTYFESLRGPRSYAVWGRGDFGMAVGVVRDFVARAPGAALRRVKRLLGKKPAAATRPS